MVNTKTNCEQTRMVETDILQLKQQKHALEIQ